jgi:membrane-associated protease RseP (regulator of RpoE activity)
VQEYVFQTGFVFLVGLMLLATWNDLVQMKIVAWVMKLAS